MPSLGNELYPEERKPLLVLIAACHSRAQLGQEGQDAAFPDSTMFGSNATRVDHEQADGRPANAAVDEFRMAERIEGSAKRAWGALQKVEAHYEAKKRGEQPGPLNLSGPAEGWAPSASQVAHAAVGGRNEGPPAIVPAGDIRARRPQAQSVVPSDGTKERIQGFLQDRKNDSEKPEQDRPDKLAQDRKEWEALLEKERQLGQGKRRWVAVRATYRRKLISAQQLIVTLRYDSSPDISVYITQTFCPRRPSDDRFPVYHRCSTSPCLAVSVLCY